MQNIRPATDPLAVGIDTVAHQPEHRVHGPTTTDGPGAMARPAPPPRIAAHRDVPHGDEWTRFLRSVECGDTCAFHPRTLGPVTLPETSSQFPNVGDLRQRPLRLSSAVVPAPPGGDPAGATFRSANGRCKHRHALTSGSRLRRFRSSALALRRTSVAHTTARAPASLRDRSTAQGQAHPTRARPGVAAGHPRRRALWDEPPPVPGKPPSRRDLT